MLHASVRLEIIVRFVLLTCCMCLDSWISLHRLVLTFDNGYALFKRNLFFCNTFFTLHIDMCWHYILPVILVMTLTDIGLFSFYVLNLADISSLLFI